MGDVLNAGLRASSALCFRAMASVPGCGQQNCPAERWPGLHLSSAHRKSRLRPDKARSTLLGGWPGAPNPTLLFWLLSRRATCLGDSSPGPAPALDHSSQGSGTWCTTPLASPCHTLLQPLLSRGALARLSHRDWGLRCRSGLACWGYSFLSLT